MGSWLGELSDGLCESDPGEGERGGGLDRIFPDRFPREFGKAVEESLGRSGLSEWFCVSQDQAHLTVPAMLGHYLAATPMVNKCGLCGTLDLRA